MITYENIEDAQNFLVKEWGDDGKRVIEECLRSRIPMTGGDFLDCCVACGGNWSGMLLTGIKELFPRVWDVIPEEMGKHAFACLSYTLKLCGVDFQE